jgi:hypothetical protein
MATAEVYLTPKRQTFHVALLLTASKRSSSDRSDRSCRGTFREMPAALHTPLLLALPANEQTAFQCGWPVDAIITSDKVVAVDRLRQ